MCLELHANFVPLSFCKQVASCCPEANNFFEYSFSWAWGGGNCSDDGRWTRHLLGALPLQSYCRGLGRTGTGADRTTVAPSKADEEDTKEVHETVVEEVPIEESHKVDTREEIMREEGAPEVQSEAEEASKVHLETEEAGKVHPYTSIMTRPAFLTHLLLKLPMLYPSLWLQDLLLHPVITLTLSKRNLLRPVELWQSSLLRGAASSTGEHEVFL